MKASKKQPPVAPTNAGAKKLQIASSRKHNAVSPHGKLNIKVRKVS